MATITGGRSRGTDSTSAPLFPLPQFQFTQDNKPNAEVLLPSLRQAGYTLERAIGDLVDNSLDANADIVIIALEKNRDDWDLTIADNGSGMDRDRLDEMMRLGSRAEHDLTTDLGAFGMGSTTASLSLGRFQHVVTNPETGVYWSAATDLDVSMEMREFVKHLDPAQPSEIDMFNTAFTRWDILVPQSGTLVRVSRCDKIERKAVKPAENAVMSYVGRTYRRYIDAGKRFFVNGREVEATDPLQRANPDTKILLEDTFDYTFPDSHVRAGDVVSIGVVLVQLPDYGGPEENRSHGISIDKSGFYLLRNGREIVEATTLDFYARHQALSRFRGELLFPAALDNELGVTFLKSAWNINLSQSLRDKIEAIVSPYIRQARRDYYKSTPTSTENVQHDEAMRRIQERSPFLRKPTTEIERRQSPELSDGHGEKTDALPKGTRQPKKPRTQSSLAAKASFEVRELGLHAPFYECDLVGGKILITYNAQHPFYQRFFLENRENRALLNAVDYLVYSMAAAELRARDEDTYQFIERMREDTSFNLRQLLVT